MSKNKNIDLHKESSKGKAAEVVQKNDRENKTSR